MATREAYEAAVRAAQQRRSDTIAAISEAYRCSSIAPASAMPEPLNFKNKARRFDA